MKLNQANKWMIKSIGPTIVKNKAAAIIPKNKNKNKIHMAAIKPIILMAKTKRKPIKIQIKAKTDSKKSKIILTPITYTHSVNKTQLYYN